MGKAAPDSLLRLLNMGKKLAYLSIFYEYCSPFVISARGMAVQGQKSRYAMTLQQVHNRASRVLAWLDGWSAARVAKCGRKLSLLLVLSTAPATLWATEFFTTSVFKASQRRGEASFAAEVDFPLTGDAAALRSVRSWLCDQLEVDVPAVMDEASFPGVLKRSGEVFLGEGEGSSRRIEIHRVYEDADVVTFSALVTDKDSATWRSEDYASFSKADGHRIEAGEVFACSEQQIKELMWKWKGTLPTDVGSPDGLVVGNVAYIDGWIVVIGPAEGYTGAAYRIKYEDAVPYLKSKPGGRYYER